MADNMHEVVKLLLARMESHPEEFAAGSSRWGWLVSDAMEHGSDEERTALKEALRPIRLKEIHEHVMDELCNGDERRRKEKEEQEYERQMMQQQMMQQQMMRINANGSVGIGSATPSTTLTAKTPSRYPTSTDMERSGVMGAIRKMLP